MYLANVIETSAVGTLVTTMSATDPDPVTDQHGQISYTFASAYNNFEIDHTSGQVGYVLIKFLFV